MRKKLRYYSVWLAARLMNVFIYGMSLLWIAMFWHMAEGWHHCATHNLPVTYHAAMCISFFITGFVLVKYMPGLMTELYEEIEKEKAKMVQQSNTKQLSLPFKK